MIGIGQMLWGIGIGYAARHYSLAAPTGHLHFGLGLLFVMGAALMLFEYYIKHKVD